MDISLEKIDAVRERTGLSYKDSKELLEKNEGSVVDALIDFEQNQHSWNEHLSNKGNEIVDKLKEVLRKGNVTRLTIVKEGETIVNIPVTAGVISMILSVPLTAFGLTAALLSKCSIEIAKEDGEIVNINAMAEKTVDKVKNVVKKEENKESSTCEENNINNDSE